MRESQDWNEIATAIASLSRQDTQLYAFLELHLKPYYFSVRPVYAIHDVCSLICSKLFLSERDFSLQLQEETDSTAIEESDLGDRHIGDTGDESLTWASQMPYHYKLQHNAPICVCLLQMFALLAIIVVIYYCDMIDCWTDQHRYIYCRCSWNESRAPDPAKQEPPSTADAAENESRAPDPPKQEPPSTSGPCTRLEFLNEAKEQIKIYQLDISTDSETHVMTLDPGNVQR